MKRSIEVTGKSVEEAVKLGHIRLGCEPGDAVMEVLDMGSKGLFGVFGKLAKVRLTIDDGQPEFEAPFDAAREEALPQSPRNERARADHPREGGRRAGVHRSARFEEAALHEQRFHDEQMSDAPAVAQLPPLALDELTHLQRKAYDYLSNVTRLMGVEVDIRMKQDEERLSIAMYGDTLGVLIGRRGETLDALQYLTSLEANKGQNDYVRISLDTENYRVRREEALTRLASRMAQRARRSGRRVVLEPMNPYERRILHSALQSDAGVSTHSEGEEPNRRVVIEPR